MWRKDHGYGTTALPAAAVVAAGDWQPARAAYEPEYGFDGPAYVRVRQAEFGFLTWFVAVVFVPTLIAVVALVILARKANSDVLRPAVVALVLFVLTLAVTVVVKGPINFAERGWNAQVPPANWASVRDRWQIAHAIRMLAERSR